MYISWSSFIGPASSLQRRSSAQIRALRRQLPEGYGSGVILTLRRRYLELFSHNDQQYRGTAKEGAVVSQSLRFVYSTSGALCIYVDGWVHDSVWTRQLQRQRMSRWLLISLSGVTTLILPD
jgi:hypothetical protein